MALSDEKIANIRKAYAEGMPQEQLRKRLHISYHTLKKILVGMPDPHQGCSQSLFSSMYWKNPTRFKRGVPAHYIMED